MSHDHEYRALVAVTIECLFAVARHVDMIAKHQEELRMDTKKLLDAVERQKTESASLRELARANNAALKDASDKLTDLQAKLDQIGGADVVKENADLKRQVEDLTMAMNEAQASIDKAADDLDADNADVEAVLKANVPAGASGGGNTSSSSSQGSDGGASSGDKPQPLPGTGAPAEPPQGDQSAPGKGVPDDSPPTSGGPVASDPPMTGQDAAFAASQQGKSGA